MSSEISGSPLLAPCAGLCPYTPHEPGSPHRTRTKTNTRRNGKGGEWVSSLLRLSEKRGGGRGRSRLRILPLRPLAFARSRREGEGRRLGQGCGNGAYDEVGDQERDDHERHHPYSGRDLMGDPEKDQDELRVSFGGAEELRTGDGDFDETYRLSDRVPPRQPDLGEVAFGGEDELLPPRWW